MDVLRRHLWFGLALITLGTAGPAAEVSREYQLKAAFLYNFIGFVDWPSEALPPPGEPLVIGLLGRDPFGRLLDELLQGERAKGRPVEVRRLHSAEEVTTCHVVFISVTERYRLREVLARCRGQPILTVSDIPGFAPAGGIIGFTTELNRIVINVNVASAEAARLTLSSKLLRVARLMSTPPFE